MKNRKQQESSVCRKMKIILLLLAFAAITHSQPIQYDVDKNELSDYSQNDINSEEILGVFDSSSWDAGNSGLSTLSAFGPHGMGIPRITRGILPI
ncbi:unnamed protein product [Acanthoscelides obtectus]|uniref:Secreted protein n=1 Tax=Acanthoscelides obtectus TaxID=200917 RepID=A0A9P0PD37_ACAOB|nr:unnamed protein product [Acanthoscelides obtectus]CAK1660462.1 hypothetical protein AOBTE_LOCUS22084 [Acanthoscelides obtectus]